VVAAVDVTTEPAPVPAAGASPAASTTAAAAETATRESVATTTTGTGAATTVDFSEVYAKRRAAVVSITSTVTAAAGPGSPGGESTAQGSGVVIDDDGHILTSEHVVDSATTVTVELSDGTTLPATIVGTDPSTDLAVLDIDADADALSPVPIADSPGIEVGDPVLAIGDPFGYQARASSGIVSGLDRSIEAP